MREYERGREAEAVSKYVSTFAHRMGISEGNYAYAMAEARRAEKESIEKNRRRELEQRERQRGYKPF